MNNARLSYIPETGMPYMYGNTASKVEKMPYKIYNDGGHYIATVWIPKIEKKKQERKKREKTYYDELFDYLYFVALSNNLSGKALFENILKGFLEIYPYYSKAEDFVKEKLENEKKKIYYRKKRLRRKAYLNKWNFFCTFTYDGKKLTEDEFKKKLRRCLSNLHTRYNWRYIGVWERSPENNRLHFHCIMYVPSGKMVGNIRVQKDYSTAKKCMQETNINDYFEKRFGRNDFSKINEMDMKNGNTMSYILKYVGKTNEKIVYSRGIQSEFVKELPYTEIASEYTDFVKKYVLYDDSISWEKDIMCFVETQISMFDKGYNQRIVC